MCRSCTQLSERTCQVASRVQLARLAHHSLTQASQHETRDHKTREQTNCTCLASTSQPTTPANPPLNTCHPFIHPSQRNSTITSQPAAILGLVRALGRRGKVQTYKGGASCVVPQPAVESFEHHSVRSCRLHHSVVLLVRKRGNRSCGGSTKPGY
jgi:hypothetical protein